jgi:peptide/nickel transport system permease protein
MLRYLSRRTLRALITLLVFQSALFLLIHALPYDIADLRGGSQFLREARRAYLGLDLPLWEQYFRWLGNFLRGDLGISFLRRGLPVADILISLAPRTLILFLPGVVGGFLLGIWLGKHIAWRRGGWFEFGATVSGTAFYTSFAPWLAFVLINIFALYLNWLPPEKLVSVNVWIGQPLTPEPVIRAILFSGVLFSLGVGMLWLATQKYKRQRAWFRLAGLALMSLLLVAFWIRIGWVAFALDILHHMILPITTLILLSFGETMLLMRTAMIELLENDHVVMAQAKGLQVGDVRDRHVARLALMPVLTRFIVHLPFVVIGSFVLERIYFVRGVGQVLFDAADSYDLPVMLGVLSVVGVLILAAHMFLDVLSAWLDPRLRDASFRPAPGG